MNGISEMCEIIPGLLLGGVRDAGQMARKGADVLVPLAFLDSGIWQTGFRGEILYYPIPDRGVLPDDVLRSLVDRIVACLDGGKKVGLFCGAGHGRTGYVAACVLARKGIKDPIGYLRRYYSEQAVETDKQTNEVLAYARSLRAEQISAEGLGENFFEYRPYYGSEPYIYLSFSEWDHDIAAETVRILNEAGFRVYYDREVLEGRLWSRSRSDRIEDSSLFFTISTPCERTSHIRLAEYHFAEMMEKPIVFLETDRKEWKYYEEDSEGIGSDPSEPDFIDKCRKVFEGKGLVPHKPQENTGKQPIKRIREKDRRWDLGITYHEHYGDEDRWFKNPRDCNLRTREAFDSHHNKIDEPSDEELYRAIGWKRIRFDLFPRSRSLDYFTSDEDKAFRRRLCMLGGKPVPEIKAEYEKEQKKIDDFWRTYPYMDEFEYVSSRLNGDDEE